MTASYKAAGAQKRSDVVTAVHRLARDRVRSGRSRWHSCCDSHPASGVCMSEQLLQGEVTRQVQPISGDRGAAIIGPTNPAREAQNPDLLVPPRVDHGTLPNLRWSFADSHMHLSPGGWGRQTTARELPVATELAGVNMRLKAGAVREMHWHKAAEWAFMLKGRARITAIDQHGHAFQDDVAEGDLWNFPAGIPHSIQGLEGDG